VRGKFRDTWQLLVHDRVSNFLAALVDPPKLRDTRHALLVHAFRDKRHPVLVLATVTSNFYAAMVDPPKLRDTRQTVLVYARDYIQFPCRICGSTEN
jgi:hypothetical protein